MSAEWKANFTTVSSLAEWRPAVVTGIDPAIRCEVSAFALAASQLRLVLARQFVALGARVRAMSR
jgi:hypothetical protein